MTDRPRGDVVEVGDGVWVPGWALAAMHGPRSPLHQWRRELRGSDPRLYAALAALCIAAQHHAATSGQDQAPYAAPQRSSTQLTTDQVATRLGISRRSVNRLIEQGLLRAERPGFGWLVPAAEVDRYRAARGAA